MVFLTIAAMGVFFASGAHAQAVIAAASDLQGVMPQIVSAFERTQPAKVRVVYGSSGTLTAQILNGAPFELFLSADEALVLRLAKEGKTVDEGVAYARGRLGLYVPKSGRAKVDADLRTLAADASVRIAIANPEHAPYGARAREAMQHIGVWTAVRERLVIGESVAQAAQFATTGNVDAALISASLAQRTLAARDGKFTLIDPSTHAPLTQRMVLLKSATADAKAFYTFMQSEEVRALFATHGFSTAR